MSRFVVALVCLLGFSLPVSAAETQTVEIVSKNGVHAFSVETATTAEEQARGLMFRKEVPEGTGMLFDFGEERPLEFWMKNTYVSLDIIFVRADGTIIRIADHTQPLSEARIPSGGPARAVLEVVAGTAQKLGIRPGDKVASPVFSRK
jgi:uncharacterized membrane protein (UPF0127 family)